MTGTRTKPDCNVRFNGGFEVTGTRTKIRISYFFVIVVLSCFLLGRLFFEKEMMSNYRKPNPKEALSLRRNFDFIYELAKFYLENLSNRVLYLCTDCEEIKAEFSKNSLFHLVGIKHKQGHNQLWLDIQNKRLKSDNILIQNFTIRKLQVMREFPNLFLGESYLTNGFELQVASFDKSLRTRKLILAVGLGKDDDGFFPQTAIDIRGNQSYQMTGKKILEIYCIDYSTGNRIYLKTKENKLIV